jgi:hypothetical protein
MPTTKVNPRAILTNHFGVAKTVAEWQKIHEIGRIYEIYGDWRVTTYGLECLTSYYPISTERLWEGKGYYDWEIHMSEKVWCNLSDFTRALEAARRHAGARS